MGLKTECSNAVKTLEQRWSNGAPEYPAPTLKFTLVLSSMSEHAPTSCRTLEHSWSI